MAEEIILELTKVSKTFNQQRGNSPYMALDNISFQLVRGDVLGIIGRNGAGKSTLLKLLSDILPPSAGKITFWGKMISILDIGSGFHPDLTGYDNIFLNASLLGMSRSETELKLDEIIKFSGIEEFIYNPIKSYSSGMYLRLAFSIAVHLNPDILILDEVVAVGDTEFRDKCNRRIHELISTGLTVILVTHNMQQILEFCKRCIWLEKGRIVLDGPAIEVVEKYIAQISSKNRTLVDEHSTISSVQLNKIIDDFMILKSVEIFSESGSSPLPIYSGDSFVIKCICEKLQTEESLEIAVSIANFEGVRVFVDSFALRANYNFDTVINKGIYEIGCTVPGNFLNRGIYHISIMVCKSFKIISTAENVITFKILLSNSNSPTENYFSRMNIIVAPRLNWYVSKCIR